MRHVDFGQLTKKFKGIPLESLKLKEDAIILKFENGEQIHIHDEPLCCESRFFSSADFPGLGTVYQGARGKIIHSIEEKFAFTVESEYGKKEFGFLAINLSHPNYSHIIEYAVVFETHNYHNGYYGGMNLYWSDSKSCPHCDDEDCES